MKTLCAALTALFTTVIIGFTVANGANGSYTESVAAAKAAAIQSTDQSNIAVELTALQESDGVRYSVTIVNPSNVPLTGLYALVALPPGTSLVQALETDGFTHFLGVLPATQGESLLWAANFKAGDYIDAFVFTLSEAAVGNIGVNLQWGGDQPGHVEFWGQPKVLAASLTENDLTLSAAGTGDALIPVGGTGVLVGAAPGQVPDGTKIHIRLMDPSEDPPVTGDVWWCSAVEVTGLPAGAEITVLVPLRQPLAPVAPVTLFSRQPNGTWGQLSVQGIVTLDGQHVAYAHRGGDIATGIQNRFQPKPILLKPPLHPTPAPPTRIPPTNKPALPTQAILLTRPFLPTLQVKVITGTPPAPHLPTRTPTLPVIRVTRIIPPLTIAANPPTTAAPPKTNVPPASTATQRPVATSAPPSVTATQGPVTTKAPSSATATQEVQAKTNVPPSATATAKPPTACLGVDVVCFGQGSANLVQVCTVQGVNCISTGNSGTICFAFLGAPTQCTAPGSTIVFKSGGSGRLPNLQLLGSPTPVVIVVTATFAPQPTICVQDSTGATACTNQNGQFIVQPSATPLPTATLRSDGGTCAFEQLPGTTDPADFVSICVDATGHECITSVEAQGIAQAFGGSAPSFCLNPNDPGYIQVP